MKRLICFMALFVLLTFSSVAQVPPLFYVAVVDDNLFVYGLTEAPIQATFNEPVPSLPSGSIIHITWSPDGQKLAYIQRTVTPDGTGFFIISHDIQVIDFTTNVILSLGVQPSVVYPISFLPDGRVMFTQEGGYPPDTFNLQVMNVFAIVPDGEAQPEQIGSFTYAIGCGGGSSFPQDTLYWEEAGGFGGNPMVLVNTATGIVHSLDCAGNGLGLLSPDGNSRVLVPSISRAKLSADGNRFLGIAFEDLLIYDLMTGTEQRIDIKSVPDQVAWGAVGTNEVFYSVITEGPTIRLQADALETFSAFVGYEQAEIPTYGLNIRKYNTANGDDTPVYGGFGSAIGRMILTPDGTTLIFSQIPNPNAWVDAVVAGELGTFDTRNALNERALLPVELILLDLATQTPTVIGTNQRQATFNFSR